MYLLQWVFVNLESVYFFCKKIIISQLSQEEKLKKKGARKSHGYNYYIVYEKLRFQNHE